MVIISWFIFTFSSLPTNTGPTELKCVEDLKKERTNLGHKIRMLSEDRELLKASFKSSTFEQFPKLIFYVTSNKLLNGFGISSYWTCLPFFLICCFQFSFLTIKFFFFTRLDCSNLNCGKDRLERKFVNTKLSFIKRSRMAHSMLRRIQRLTGRIIT